MGVRLENKEWKGIGCLTVFALPFAIVGLVVALWMGRSVCAWLGARNWVEARADLISANLDEGQGSGSPTYRVVARYEYDYLGHRYTGTRVGIQGGADNLGDWQQRVYAELNDQLQRHASVPCFVNPHNPSESVLHRDLRWSMLGFQSLFAMCFGLVGFGLLAGVWVGAGKMRAKKALQAANPGEPWKWLPEWSGGLIHSTNRAQMIFTIVFAIFWNAISAPLLFLLPHEVIDNGNRVALIGLLFPLVGAGLIVWAVRCTIRSIRFGKSTFQMASVPGVLGGRVAGAVWVPASVRPGDGFRVTLSCIKTVTTGSGKSRQTTERILWQAVRQVLSEPVRNIPDAQVVPVLFGAPNDLPPSSTDTAQDKITWRLEVAAKIPGVDYLSQFELPVFRTRESRADFKLDESGLAKYELKQDPEKVLREAGLLLSKRADDLTIDFPMARNPGSALGTTAFFVVWTAIAVFISKSSAPVIFPVVFGFFDLLIFFGMMDAWLGTARIDAGPDAMTLSYRMLGMGRTVRLESDQIDSIATGYPSQQGTTSSYVVRIRTKDGKMQTAGRPLRSQPETDALAEMLRQARKT